MEQSDTNIEVAKVTEANEFNSGQPQVINSSSDSKDQVENGNIPLSTEETASSDLQAQEKAGKFVSDTNTSSSKIGTLIQAESTLGQNLQEHDSGQGEEEEEEAGEEEEEDTFNEGLLPIPCHTGKNIQRKPLQEPKDVDQIRRGSVMMALPSNFGKNVPLGKGVSGSILPGFDPRDDDIPSDPKILNACKRQGIEPKELVLQDYDDFKDSMCNVPLHVVKIRYRHHKKCVKDLLTIVSDDMKANESREVMVQLAEKNRKLQNDSVQRLYQDF